MGSHRERLLHDFSTSGTLLRGEVGIHSYHMMTSSLSLVFKDSEECTPTGVHDALCQRMILYQIEKMYVIRLVKRVQGAPPQRKCCTRSAMPHEMTSSAVVSG